MERHGDEAQWIARRGARLVRLATARLRDAALRVMLVGDEVARERIPPLYACRWREETWHGQAKDVLGGIRAQVGDVARQDRWPWVVLAGW